MGSNPPIDGGRSVARTWKPIIRGPLIARSRHRTIRLQTVASVVCFHDALKLQAAPTPLSCHPFQIISVCDLVSMFFREVCMCRSIDAFVRCRVGRSLVCALISTVSLTGCSDQGASQPATGTATSAVRSVSGARLIRDSDDTVIGVNFFSTDADDADLKQIAEYSQVQRLRVQECGSIDGSGLEVVAELPDLTDVELLMTPVTDDGLLNLREASALAHLVLMDVNVTNEGLAFLAGCPEVQTITLEGLEISDAGLTHLSGLTQLESLSLENCPGITGSGFSSLSALPALSEVNLVGTGVLPDHIDNLRLLEGVHEIKLDAAFVTDDVLAELAQIQSLERVRLFGAPLTDRGLEHLSGFQNLQVLELAGSTDISNEGIKSLEGHSSLKRLDLTACPQIDDACIPTLASIETPGVSGSV